MFGAQSNFEAQKASQKATATFSVTDASQHTLGLSLSLSDSLSVCRSACGSLCSWMAQVGFHHSSLLICTYRLVLSSRFPFSFSAHHRTRTSRSFSTLPLPSSTSPRRDPHRLSSCLRLRSIQPSVHAHSFGHLFLGIPLRPTLSNRANQPAYAAPEPRSAR